MKKKLLLIVFMIVTASLSGQERNRIFSSESAFVRVSRENPCYFEFSDGQSYIPVGANICYAKDMDTMESYFRKLS